MAISSTELMGHSCTDKSKDNCIVRDVVAIFMKSQSGTILIMNHSISIHESINRMQKKGGINVFKNSHL